ncbi:MAG: flagellar export chaperone FliS [Pseudomonadota bacterium]
MSGYGARAYQRVGVDSGVAAADPHRLVLMLFDGALEAIKLAQAHIATGNVAGKGQALGKAVRIVEEGLKASLDKDAGGPLARQLAALYDYASLRLLQANLKNDHAALDEVSRLLADLRDAWAQIGARAPVAKSEAAANAAAAAPTVGASMPPAARLFDDASAGPVRGVVVTA